MYMVHEQLAVFKLDEFMDRNAFVSDRRSNFVSWLRDFRILFCVVHQLNTILKRTHTHTLISSPLSRYYYYYSSLSLLFIRE